MLATAPALFSQFIQANLFWQEPGTKRSLPASILVQGENRPITRYTSNKKEVENEKEVSVVGCGFVARRGFGNTEV